MSATDTNNVTGSEPASPTQTNNLTGENTDNLLNKNVQQSDPASSAPKKKPLPRDESGSTSPKKESGDSTPKSPRDRAQQPFSSKDSIHKRVRTVSAMSGGGGSLSGRGRSDSVSSYARRPSLSFGHADSLPMYLDKPTPEEIGTEEGKRVFGFACVVNCVVLGTNTDPIRIMIPGNH